MNGKTQNLAQAYDDQRSQIRLVTKLEAKVFPGAKSCLIADISNLGCRLQFNGKVSAPEEFILVEWNGGRAYQCRVAWRQEDRVGVEFLSTASLQGQAPEVFAAAQKAWVLAADRPTTTFTVRKHNQGWVVTISGPTLGEPAVVGGFPSRWQALRFARTQAENFEGRACATRG